MCEFEAQGRMKALLGAQQHLKGAEVGFDVDALVTKKEVSFVAVFVWCGVCLLYLPWASDAY